jgi:hypothetical protein
MKLLLLLRAHHWQQRWCGDVLAPAALHVSKPIAHQASPVATSASQSRGWKQQQLVPVWRHARRLLHGLLASGLCSTPRPICRRSMMRASQHSPSRRWLARLLVRVRGMESSMPNSTARCIPIERRIEHASALVSPCPTRPTCMLAWGADGPTRSVRTV